MYKFMKFMCILFVIINYVEAGRINSKTNNNRRNYYGSQMTQQQQQPTESASLLTPKEFLDKKSGISTFGIISIIFIIIVGCLAFYYGVMCYPLLCRKEKKYRFLHISSIITTDTAGSIQSIDQYPDEQKHMPIEQKNTF